MKAHFITFRSVTYAQRGEGMLRSAGIRCTLLRTPRWMEEQGCGYCLRLHQRDLHKGLEVLQQRQVPFRKVYLQAESGEIREVVL